MITQNEYDRIMENELTPLSKTRIAVFVLGFIASLICVRCYFLETKLDMQVKQIHYKDSCFASDIVKYQKEIMISDTVLDSTNLMNEILRAKIQQPLWVFAQAYNETGNLKCKDCSLNKNNLFGFRSDSTKHYQYDSWQESVWAYKLWQKKRYNGKDDYGFFLLQNWKTGNVGSYMVYCQRMVEKWCKKK